MVALNSADFANESSREATNEPNENYPNANSSSSYASNGAIGTIDYEDEEDDAIMAAEEEIEVDVAIDSGCVCHAVKPGDVPAGVAVTQSPNRRRRNLVAANGSDMENYGDATVEMVQENGHVIGSTLTVTDVTRPLHSTSQVCDTASGACPDGHEVLYTKAGATVVPDGALSRFLGSVRHVANYPRRGGLYVAKMKIRAPRTRNARTTPGPNPARLRDRPDPKKPGAQGFGRQGTKR